MASRALHPTFILLLSALAACSTSGAVSARLNDQASFSQQVQSQRQIAHRYPHSFDASGNLASVTLDNPRLATTATDNRLRLDIAVCLRMLGRPDRSSGHLALAGGLRHEPTTQGLLLVDPKRRSFEIPGSGCLLEGGARSVVNALLAELARNEPVYRLEPGLLSKLPAGRRIGDVAIRHGNIVGHLDRRLP